MQYHAFLTHHWNKHKWEYYCRYKKHYLTLASSLLNLKLRVSMAVD